MADIIAIDTTAYYYAGPVYRYGTYLADTLYGYDGVDYMYGYGGNDVLYAYGGDDIVYGHSGNDRLYGGLGNDKLYGGIGNDTVYGQDGDDRLYGEAGDDYLSGGNGVDWLYGGTGHDRLYGGYGNDRLEGGTGNDYQNGGYGSDNYVFRAGDGTDTVYDYDTPTDGYGDVDTLTFYGQSEADLSLRRNGHHLIADYGSGDSTTVQYQFYSDAYGVEKIYVGGRTYDFQVGTDAIDWLYGSTGSDLLYGGIGADNLVGYDGADALLGEAGNDNLWGYGGNDKIHGGTGYDTIYGGAGYDWLYGDGHNDVLHGEDGGDWIYGGTGSDVLEGGAGSDVLQGESGNDRLVGGTGADWLYGGTGSDVYVYGREEGNDYISEGYTGGTDTLELNMSWWEMDVRRDGNSLVFTHLRSGDSLYVANQFVSGYDGIEHIKQFGTWDFGLDQLFVGTAGNDKLIGNYSFVSEVYYAGAGDDELRGGLGRDEMWGGDGDDWIYGGADYDHLYGDDGNDVLSGGVGGDTLEGGAGHDWLFGEDHEDRLYGGDGHDRLEGGSGHDDLYGGNGNDVLYGDRSYNAGTATTTSYDELHGGAGNDRLYAGTGSTGYYGGTGNDLLYGGKGRDYYMFEWGDGDDVIYDTGAGKLRFDWDNYTPREERIAWTDMDFTRSGNNLVIDYGESDSVTLVNQFAGGGVDELLVRKDVHVGYMEYVDLADFESGAPERTAGVNLGGSLSGTTLAGIVDGGASAEYEFMDLTGGNGQFTVDGATDSHFEAMATQLDQVSFASADTWGAQDSVFVRTSADGSTWGEWMEVEVTTNGAIAVVQEYEAFAG